MATRRASISARFTSGARTSVFSCDSDRARCVPHRSRVIRQVNPSEREQIEYGASHYVALTRDYLAGSAGSSVR